MLVFVPQEFYISEAEEQAEYDKHQNSPEDSGYRKFLSRLADPLSALISEGAAGLDFGCGPGPTLSVMLHEKGFNVQLFDKFYYPNRDMLDNKYDFVTSTEVLEHLRDPAKTLERIWRCVKPGGYLGVMTKLAQSADAFSRWHYKNDPTHIIFFSKETFCWLAGQWGAEIVYQEKDVTILRKSNNPT